VAGPEVLARPYKCETKCEMVSGLQDQVRPRFCKTVTYTECKKVCVPLPNDEVASPSAFPCTETCMVDGPANLTGLRSKSACNPAPACDTGCHDACDPCAALGRPLQQAEGQDERLLEADQRLRLPLRNWPHGLLEDPSAKAGGFFFVFVVDGGWWTSESKHPNPADGGNLANRGEWTTPPPGIALRLGRGTKSKRAYPV